MNSIRHQHDEDGQVAEDDGDQRSEESREYMHQESSLLLTNSSNQNNDLSSTRVDRNDDDFIPQARNHSYLPGTSHPLMPESLLLSSSSFKNDKNTSSSFLTEEIPLLMLPGIVVFPGTTLPIRLQDASARSWRQCLSRKIEESRRHVSHPPAAAVAGGRTSAVSFGVLTKLIPESQRRSSWMRSGIHTRRNTAGITITDYSNNNNNNHNRMAQEELSRLLLQAMEDDSDSDSTPLSDLEEERDPLVGRIGTMVTIINTHGDATMESDDWTQSSTWQHHHEDQLVVTALGTGRFRIVQRVLQNTDLGRVTNPLSPDHNLHQAVPFYRVQHLCDDELPPPCIPKMRMNPALSHHEQIISNLAVVSPIPKFVYSQLWPWKLVEKIRSNIQRVKSLEGLTQLSEYAKKGPTTFSFWASSNMPLNETEKLELLQTDCTIERLQWIRSKIEELEQEESVCCYYYCCKRCYTLLSPVSRIFTVGGAEGTTGAYVNEYGVIHQTITFKDIEAHHALEYVGLPETRDSWFPGYAWTITYCRRCRHHLGWKFDTTTTTSATASSISSSTSATTSSNTRNDVNEHRPDRFWGFTGSSVTTCKVRIPRP